VPIYNLMEDAATAEISRSQLWQWGQGVTRDYTAADVLRLRGSVDIEHTLAERGAERLWDLLQHRARACARSAR
jgi:isocitrate lyase